MASSVSSSFQELNKLNNVKPNSFPTLYQGKLSDPTSWSQLLCCCCCKDKDPDHVNTYLQAVINDLSEEIKGKSLNENQSTTIKNSIAKLDSLSAKYSSIHLPKADGEFSTNFADNASTARELIDMKEMLNTAANANISFKKHAKSE